ncbi:MAG: ATP-sensitive inward rectifier potassium channel 10 [Deltaproteobacteria bacterium]|nr:ATP-sensitive inward rectifier potassium channel 10 [Deltaproteobacteria bacterium]
MLADPELYRIVRRDGGFNVVSGIRVMRDMSDVAHWLLKLSWTGFFVLIAGGYFGVNAFFAAIYLAGDMVAGAEPGSFSDAFAFSVQTMSTIGYGALTPASKTADLLTAVEVLIGLLGFAVVTGMLFARFSRPSARVLFSDVAVVRERDGQPTLQFRMANERGNLIVDARLNVVMAYNHRTAEGEQMRSFIALQLVRERSPVFALSWTAMHEIDPSSPLYGWTPEHLEEVRAEIVVTVTGIDDTFNQHVHSQHSFLWSEVRWNHRFVDVIEMMPDGKRTIAYERFHDVLPLDPTE